MVVEKHRSPVSALECSACFFCLNHLDLCSYAVASHGLLHCARWDGGETPSPFDRRSSPNQWIKRPQMLVDVQRRRIPGITSAPLEAVKAPIGMAECLPGFGRINWKGCHCRIRRSWTIKPIWPRSTGSLATRPPMALSRCGNHRLYRSPDAKRTSRSDPIAIKNSSFFPRRTALTVTWTVNHPISTRNAASS